MQHPPREAGPGRYEIKKGARKCRKGQPTGRFCPDIFLQSSYCRRILEISLQSVLLYPVFSESNRPLGSSLQDGYYSRTQFHPNHCKILSSGQNKKQSALNFNQN
jgi:hypothetical protein